MGGMSAAVVRIACISRLSLSDIANEGDALMRDSMNLKTSSSCPHSPSIQFQLQRFKFCYFHFESSQAKFHQLKYYRRYHPGMFLARGI